MFSQSCVGQRSWGNVGSSPGYTVSIGLCLRGGISYVGSSILKVIRLVPLLPGNSEDLHCSSVRSSMRHIFKTLVSGPLVVNVFSVPSKHRTICRDPAMAAFEKPRDRGEKNQSLYDASHRKQERGAFFLRLDCLHSPR